MNQNNHIFFAVVVSGSTPASYDRKTFSLQADDPETTNERKRRGILHLLMFHA